MLSNLGFLLLLLLHIGCGVCSDFGNSLLQTLNIVGPAVFFVASTVFAARWHGVTRLKTVNFQGS